MQVTGQKGAAVAAAERAAPPKTREKEGSGVARRSDTRRSPCPVACALDVVGDRWTLLLIRDLLGGKKRYGELLSASERIPTNILADRLKRLEREGLIRRVPYSAHPPRDEYELTEQGRELSGPVEALAIWGTRHFPGTRRRARRAAEQDPAPA
jgi:DNA-binding HxlR family transcriptional regulator